MPETSPTLRASDAHASGPAAEAYEIREIAAADCRPLRIGILRPGLDPVRSVYPLDDLPDTYHLGGFVAGRLCPIASFSPEVQPDDPRPGQWRLRGMVTRPELRGGGLGSAVVRAGIEEAQRRGGHTMWLHGRVAAMEFYRRLGFVAVGEVFDTPGTGPHFRMVRPL